MLFSGSGQAFENGPSFQELQQRPPLQLAQHGRLVVVQILIQWAGRQRDGQRGAKEAGAAIAYRSAVSLALLAITAD